MDKFKVLTITMQVSDMFANAKLSPDEGQEVLAYLIALRCLVMETILKSRTDGMLDHGLTVHKTIGERSKEIMQESFKEHGDALRGLEQAYSDAVKRGKAK